jgi:LmbE family N-acetylglucosaminyl deacetylase
MVATGASKSEIVCKFMNYDRGDEVLPVHRICPEYMSLICDRAAVSDYIQTKELKITQKSGRVLVFSPHPDDDVIGMGGTISKYAQNGVIVDVCYMTGGQNKTRVQEAVKALEVLCGDHHTAHFLDLPFYSRVDRKITKEDHQTLTNFLSQCLDYTDKYLAVYVCGDLRDPSDTHKNCYTILTNVVRMWLSTQLQDLLRENTPWYVYFSVWYTPDLYKYVSHLSHVETETTNDVIEVARRGDQFIKSFNMLVKLWTIFLFNVWQDYSFLFIFSANFWIRKIAATIGHAMKIIGINVSFI